MNRVLEVSERNAYALVEPGVSYFDLYRYIEEKGYKVWVDVPDPGWGSPIGNALDHGGGYLASQFRNHFDSHCGMEVVLANGDLLRTGMGAMPGAKTWQDYKFGSGPWIDGLFSQGNSGVVTKMGFWLMPQPDAYLTGTVTVTSYEDIIPMVDVLTFLENSGISTGVPGLGSPVLGGFMMPPPKPEVTTMLNEGGIASPKLQQYARQNSIPFWNCTVKFYGPSKVIAAQWDYAKEKFSAIAGARFQDGESRKLPLTPTNGHMWFSPIIPRTGEAILEANRVFSQAAKDIGLPSISFSLPSTYWTRSFIFLFGLPITCDVATNRRNRESFKKLIRICAEHGWGEYRTPPAFQDTVMDTYSFNNHALGRFHETVKGCGVPQRDPFAGPIRHLAKELERKESMTRLRVGFVILIATHRLRRAMLSCKRESRSTSIGAPLVTGPTCLVPLRCRLNSTVRNPCSGSSGLTCCPLLRRLLCVKASPSCLFSGRQKSATWIWMRWPVTFPGTMTQPAANSLTGDRRPRKSCTK